MEEEKLISLIRQYVAGEASKAEFEELTAFIGKDENQEMFSSALEKVLEQTGAKGAYDETRYDPLLKTILGADKINKPAIKRTKVFQLYPLSRWVAAAAIIFMISAGAYFYFNNKAGLRQDQADMTQTKRFKNDVAPGGNKAILTLANGKQIILDTTTNGIVTQQGNTKIIKLDSGQVAYKASSSSGGGLEEAGYNIITTPKGGQYQIVLADGSKVWLNAASSLKYPTAFTGKERSVELTGEAYFEVVHNGNMPFKVTVGNETIEDLGTHFNINAYMDEAAIKTTLLEGSVKVTLSLSKGASPSPSERDGVRLKPGEQAQIENHGNPLIPKITVQTVDVEDVVAWKDGKFRFNKVDIQSIMRQAARWYDVEVEFKGDIPETFSGGIPRNMNVSQLLKVLEYSNKITFEIEGRKINVKPK